MNRNRGIIVAAVLLLVGTTAVAEGSFAAKASGAQSLPAPGPGFIESASVTADFNDDFSAVQVKLTVDGGLNVVAAHFHCGRPGSGGPVAFGLFSPGPLEFDGTTAAGTLTPADYTGADCTNAIGRQVNTLAALAFAMRDGLIYLNVHTTDNPPGETRGQMLPVKGKGLQASPGTR